MIKLDDDGMVEEGLGRRRGLRKNDGREKASGLASDVVPPAQPDALPSSNRSPASRALTIFADNDDTGLRDARECQQRWTDAGLEAPIKYRAESGKDFADA